jgi:hypothetical protein
MPDYERTTTETTLERLPADLRTALLERIESALLTVPADAETSDLLVATHGERSGRSWWLGWRISSSGRSPRRCGRAAWTCRRRTGWT